MALTSVFFLLGGVIEGEESIFIVSSGLWLVGSEADVVSPGVAGPLPSGSCGWQCAELWVKTLS